LHIETFVPWKHPPKPVMVPSENPRDLLMQFTYPGPLSSWLTMSALWCAIAGSGAGTLAAEPAGLGPEDRETLLHYARDTWRSFESMAAPGVLPADGLRRGGSEGWVATKKTTPTDIAAYLWSTLAAAELGVIDWSVADRRVDRLLHDVARMPREHGFFFDRIDPQTGATLKRYPDDGAPIRPLISAVDNGWLATALWIVRNRFPGFRDRADALLRDMDFRFFYEPYDPADPEKHLGQLHGVYWPDDGTFGTLHGLINTEPRIASYIGIARGQLPPEHYFRVHRTWRPGQGPPDQRQQPAGEPRTYLGVDVFEGHYSYRGLNLVPSWGGSMFEALMVPLFVPEARWARRSWGVNHPLYVRTQIEHGLEEARYGFWGFSPACRPRGGYRTYGVDAIGACPDGYTSNDSDVPAGKGKGPSSFAGGVVTPHASFLALRFAPREATDILRALTEKFPIYGDHGFLDSVNVSTGEVADCILALDQGMIMAAIAHALADEFIQHAFSDGMIEAAIRPLIGQEEFTAGSSAAPPDDH
jgi:hypothetical protein